MLALEKGQYVSELTDGVKEMLKGILHVSLDMDGTIYWVARFSLIRFLFWRN